MSIQSLVKKLEQAKLSWMQGEEIKIEFIDACIDLGKQAIARAEHDPYDEVFIAYGLPKQDNTDLDAICQDLQEKTYTQAMRIAELEAKLAEAEKHEVSQEPVAWQWRRKDKAWSLDNTFNSEVYPTTLDSEVRPLYTHPQPKRYVATPREPLTKDQILALWEDTYVQRGSTGIEFARAVEAAHGITSDMKQEHVDKTAKQRHEWVGLTDEDRQAAFESLPDMLDGFLHKWGWLHFSKAIEAKLKEKNT